MGEDSLHMPLLLCPLLGAQVPLPRHDEEVIMVQLIIKLSTEASADHPPGGEHGPCTVVSTQPCQLGHSETLEMMETRVTLRDTM